MATKDNDKLPAPQDLTTDELRADLHRFEVSGLWGIGKLKFTSTAQSVGPVLAALLLLAGASGVGYLVHQLTVATALPLIPGLCITLASAILVLGVAIWFVLKLNNPNNPTKRRNNKKSR